MAMDFSRVPSHALKLKVLCPFSQEPLNKMELVYGVDLAEMETVNPNEEGSLISEKMDPFHRG